MAGFAAFVGFVFGFGFGFGFSFVFVFVFGFDFDFVTIGSIIAPSVTNTTNRGVKSGQSNRGIDVGKP